MERYRLVGVNLDSGEDASVIVEAHNESDARLQATKLRIALAELVPLAEAETSRATGRPGRQRYLIVLTACVAVLAVSTAGGFYWLHVRLAEHDQQQQQTAAPAIPAAVTNRLQAVESELARLKVDTEMIKSTAQIKAEQLVEQLRGEMQVIASQAASQSDGDDDATNNSTLLADIDMKEKYRERIIADLDRNQRQIDEAASGMNNARDSFERGRWEMLYNTYHQQRETLKTKLRQVNAEIYQLRQSL